MVKRVILAAVLLAVSVGVRAQEAVTLTTPLTPPSRATCHVSTLFLNVDGNAITVTLACNNGDGLVKIYDSTTVPTGATLLHSLNIGNFSVNSLMKAIYSRLNTDGVLVGSVSGVPQ